MRLVGALSMTFWWLCHSGEGQNPVFVRGVRPQRRQHIIAVDGDVHRARNVIDRQTWRSAAHRIRAFQDSPMRGAHGGVEMGSFSGKKFFVAGWGGDSDWFGCCSWCSNR